MDGQKTVDYCRFCPIWVENDGYRSCRLCERRDCIHAGTWYTGCTMHTEKVKKEKANVEENR